jgi:hypothetical protein
LVAADVSPTGVESWINSYTLFGLFSDRDRFRDNQLENNGLAIADQTGLRLRFDICGDEVLEAM